MRSNDNRNRNSAAPTRGCRKKDIGLLLAVLLLGGNAMAQNSPIYFHVEGPSGYRYDTEQEAVQGLLGFLFTHACNVVLTPGVWQPAMYSSGDFQIRYRIDYNFIDTPTGQCGGQEGWSTFRIGMWCNGTCPTDEDFDTVAIEPPPQRCPATGNNGTNPCNPANGNKSEIQVDYASAPGAGLEFARYYNSKGPIKTGKHMGVGWRHTWSRTMGEEPDRRPTMKFVSPVNQSSFHHSAFDACRDGWDEIKNDVFGGDLASATASPVGEFCRLTQDFRTVAYLPIRSRVGWAGSYRAPSSIEVVTRPNGATHMFRWNSSGGGWLSELDPRVSLRQSGLYWYFTDANDTEEKYDNAGRLVEVRYRNGQTETLDHRLSVSLGGDGDDSTLDRVTGPFGHVLWFRYNGNGLVDRVETPDGDVVYGYDADDNLVNVTYPDGTTREYLYEDTRYPNHLTGIVDESGSRYATWEYDDAGRAVLSEHAGGHRRVQLDYNADGSTTLTMANGAERTYHYSTQQGTRKLAMVSGAVCSSCPLGNVGGRTFDANGFVDETLDWDNRITQSVRNARGLVETLIEARGTTEERTTGIAWHPDFRLPTQITTSINTTGFDYDADGNLESATISDGVLSRTLAITYNAQGQPLSIDGPRTDVVDVTQLTYYDCSTGAECGQLATAVNAAGHATTFNSYDASGRLLQMTDPNGLVTNFEYDERGRMTLVVQTNGVGAGRSLSISYHQTGQIASISGPAGLSLDYLYDTAHNLRSISDNFNNRIEYDYDAMGNVTGEDVRDPQGTLTRSIDYTHDLNERLASISNAGFVTDVVFDLTGNLIEETDARTAVTTHVYDALDRLKTSTDALSGNLDIDYDSHDNVTSITTPGGVVTSYVYDGLDNLIREDSPDRGTLSYTYDEAGNRLSATDARGIVTTYAYDALNRLESITHAGGSTTVLQYDTGPNSIGRLSRITDRSGETSWTYDDYGATTSRIQKIGDVSLTTGFEYDDSGKLIAMTLPSGKTIGYDYDVFLPDRVSVDGATLMDEIAFEPFGPVTGWTWGNGTAAMRDYSLRGLMTTVSLGPDTRAFTHDDVGNVIAMSDSVIDNAYEYDLLGRLTEMENLVPGGASSQLFSAPPVLLATIQTTNNEVAEPGRSPWFGAGGRGKSSRPTGAFGARPDGAGIWLTAAVDGVGPDEARLVLDAGRIGPDAAESAETIGYVAVADGRYGSFMANGKSVLYEAQVTTDSVRGWGEGCHETTLLNAYPAPPKIVAAMNSRNGDNGGWVRHCNTTATATAGFAIDSDAFSDSERSHAAEHVGLMAFSSAFDAEFTDANGTWRMEVATVDLSHLKGRSVYRDFAFRQSYPSAPIVIILATDRNSDPTTVRIRNVTTQGFEASQAETPSSDGIARPMTVTYLAIEPGVHELPDGTRLTAGAVSTSAVQSGPGPVDLALWQEAEFPAWPAATPGVLPAIQQFAYDSNGNRTSLTEDAQTHVYTRDVLSNRLLSVTGPVARNFEYDAAGNAIADGIHSYDYDDRGRLTAVDGGSTTYEYNALGQRVRKAGGTTTLFVYGESGELIGEYDAAGNAVREHVWFDGAPVALLQDDAVLYVHTDQLGTPRVVTDGDSIVWRWISDAFGTTLPDADVDGDGTLLGYHLRFPGQYYDAESGLNYNYMRDYDPALGQYMQSDPIGLAGGLSAYAYAAGNPLGFSDPTGECPWCIGAAIGAALELISQIAQHGLDWNCISLEDIAESAALGALGGGLAGNWAKKALTNALKKLRNGTKGTIGEGMSFLKHLMKGRKHVASQERIPNQTSIADHVFRDKAGNTLYVESKFGTSGLTNPQRRARDALRNSTDSRYVVDRWKYPFFEKAGERGGAAAGGAAGAGAAQATDYAECGCGGE